MGKLGITPGFLLTIASRLRFPFTAMIHPWPRTARFAAVLVGFLELKASVRLSVRWLSPWWRDLPFTRKFSRRRRLHMVLILYLSALATFPVPFIVLCRSLDGDLIPAPGRSQQSTLTYMNAEPEYRSRVLGVLALCIGTPLVLLISAGWRRVTDCPPRSPSWRSKDCS